MIKTLKLITFSTTLSTLLLFTGFSSAYADKLERDIKEFRNTVLAHTPPAQLGVPGQPLRLNITLKNTDKFFYSLRVAAVIDGKLIEYSVPEGGLDISDTPFYNVDIFNPLETLSYRIMLYGPGDEMIISKRYTIRRDCKPNLETVKIEQIDKHPLEFDKVKLGKQALRLESELNTYQRALELMEDVDELMNNITSEGEQ